MRKSKNNKQEKKRLAAENKKIKKAKRKRN